MKQEFTSAATSINSVKLPAVFSKLPTAPAPAVILDFGCGKYTDHIRAALPAGTEYLPFDVYNQPQHINDATMRRAAELRAQGTPITVVCSNVLNVIKEDAIIEEIADQLTCLPGPDGVAFITVYEGNRSGRGRQTGPDQYQRNEKLREYLRFFPHAEIRNGMIVLL